MWTERVPEKPNSDKNRAKTPTSNLSGDTTACAIWEKLCLPRELHNVIMHANFCFDQFRGFSSGQDRNSAFPILIRTLSLTVYGASAPIRDYRLKLILCP